MRPRPYSATPAAWVPATLEELIARYADAEAVLRIAQRARERGDARTYQRATLAAALDILDAAHPPGG